MPNQSDDCVPTVARSQQANQTMPSPALRSRPALRSTIPGLLKSCCSLRPNPALLIEHALSVPEAFSSGGHCLQWPPYLTFNLQKYTPTYLRGKSGINFRLEKGQDNFGSQPLYLPSTFRSLRFCPKLSSIKSGGLIEYDFEWEKGILYGM
jgi:hypothetical protein